MSAGDRSAQKRPKVGEDVPKMCRVVGAIGAAGLLILIFVMMAGCCPSKRGLNFFRVKPFSQY